MAPECGRPDDVGATSDPEEEEEEENLGVIHLPSACKEQPQAHKSLTDSSTAFSYESEESPSHPGSNSHSIGPQAVERVSTMTNAQIAASLRRAKQERVYFFWRVRLPCVVACAGLSVGSFMFSKHFGGTTEAISWFCGDCFLSLANLFLLLAILPADRWCPRVGSILVSARCVRGIQVNLVAMARLLAGPCHLRNLPEVPCLVRNLEFPLYVGCSMVWLSAAIYVLLGLRRLPRVNLNRLWNAVIFLNLGRALVSLSRIPVYSIEKAMLPELRVDRGELVVWLVNAIYHTGMGFMLMSKQFRRRAQWCMQANSGDVTAAKSIAAYIGGQDPDVIMARARKSCRCVTLDVVTQKDMEKSSPDVSLQRLSTPCRLEDIDAFLSHSWHDPPEMKWQALQAWRREFRAANRREPRVWIDKYCIDQTNIQASLNCLPVFLAGCHSLLILAGPTYLSRLWCVEELFIFLQMCREVEAIDLRILSSEVPELISNFTVRDAQCHLASDEETLRAAIEAGCSDLNSFDAHVRDALQSAYHFRLA